MSTPTAAERRRAGLRLILDTVRARRRHLQVDAAVKEFRGGVHELEAHIGELLTGDELERFGEARRRYAEAGLPPLLAARVASLEPPS